MIVKTLTYFCITYKTPKLCLYKTSRRFHTIIEDSITSISSSNLKQTLKQNNVLFNDGHVCIIADCPICKTSTSDCKQPKVYVNKKTGFFMCDNCKCKGTWDILEKFFTTRTKLPNREDLEALKSTLVQKDELCDKLQNIQMNCEKISDLSKDAFTAIRNELSLPNLQQEDLCTLNCMHDKVTSTLHFPLIAFNTHITGYKSLSYLTGKNATQQTIPHSNCCGTIVYRYNNKKSNGTAVVVPTVIDMLALISQKSANVIICLPYGLQNLPQEALPSLEDYTKLILWFGNDAHSWDVAKQFARKLNEKRCAFVRPTELQPAPYIASKAGCNLKNIIQQARPIWHESITTFHDLREDVLSELQNTDKVQGIKWKKFPSLNRILKGHRRGEFTVLTGPTGCGKTTFMSEYSLDLAMQGVNTLWGSFEIRNVRLAKTMLQQMAGVPLEDNLEHFDSYANAFETLPVYFTVFHGQQSIQVVMDAVEHATYVHDISHVIIDNVQFMMGTSAKFDRFLQQDDIIAAFRTFATKYNCHVTLVMHPRKERDDGDLTISSIFGSAKASQEADNVLIIQDKRLNSARGKTYLQVAKNRYTGDLGIMLLEFDRTSTSFSKKKAKTESPVKIRNIGFKREEPILQKQVSIMKR